MTQLVQLRLREQRERLVLQERLVQQGGRRGRVLLRRVLQRDCQCRKKYQHQRW